MIPLNQSNNSAQNISPLKIWLMASRLKTLPAAIAPILIATAMAYGDGKHHFLSAAICLLCALLIQIGTNLANDYFDFIKGTDTEKRIGPTRVTAAGLASPAAVRNAFIIVFGAAILLSLYIVHRGGLPIIIIGILSIASGILYTAGPKPLGYIGLGDLFVLIFFGPVALAGTYYVQTLTWSLPAILAGFAVGFISVSMLAVNNYRDIDDDKKTGKCTLAVRFGKTFAKGEFIFSILMPIIFPIIIYLLIRSHAKILISSLVPLIAIPSIHIVLTKTDGPSLNAVLASTGKLLLIYSIFFSIGWIL